MFDKGLKVRQGQAPVHNYIDLLLDLVATDKVRLDDIISHRLPLAASSSTTKRIVARRSSSNLEHAVAIRRWTTICSGCRARTFAQETIK